MLIMIIIITIKTVIAIIVSIIYIPKEELDRNKVLQTFLSHPCCFYILGSENILL